MSNPKPKKVDVLVLSKSEKVNLLREAKEKPTKTGGSKILAVTC